MIHRFLTSLLAALLLILALPAFADGTVLSKYLPEVKAADLVQGADAFGPIQGDLAVAPVLKGGQQIGWAYITLASGSSNTPNPSC